MGGCVGWMTASTGCDQRNAYMMAGETVINLTSESDIYYVFGVLVIFTRDRTLEP